MIFSWSFSHKQVAEANFALHESHCRRFLCVCPDCDETVPREQLDQHREEQHTKVRCSKCNQKMERCHLMDHESEECVERLQKCQFCELEMPFKGLDEHCLVCGSRTELCKDCGRYVTLKELPTHALTCSDGNNPSGPPQNITKPSPNKAEITVSCSVCKAMFPVEDVEEHELECILAATRKDIEAEVEKREEEEEERHVDHSKQESSPQLSSMFKATSLSDKLSNGGWRNGGDPYQISTCPYCHLALPVVTLRWHEAKCRVHVLLK
ncbi:XIAP-associated factor 1-like protein [Xyrichtys novacula]|uniref:XIAP-associated factor 1-like protein n=1 Tax=Xyrichtys novacula TaxID=13765 RepID=A0AAV1FYH0_XYRNO|nr:XIAP-associated factor 1-like protein [Xyrichtys novacula]